MLAVVFEPTITAGQRPQTYALERAATGIGKETGIPRVIFGPKGKELTKQWRKCFGEQFCHVGTMYIFVYLTVIK